MKRVAAFLFLLAAACGGSTPPPATPVPPPKQAKNPDSAPASREPLFVELVTIHRKWVTPYVPAPIEDVKAWATTNVEPSFAWVLVKSDPKAGGDAAAKAKAQKLLARTKKEPFAAVARDSDDAASKNSGGLYPPAGVKSVAKEAQDAWAALKPGETSPVFACPGGFAFVRKDSQTETALVELYRAAKSGETMKKLGAEMTKHLRNSPDLREAIADSVTLVLGDLAAADPDRPKTSVVDRERIKDLKHLSAAVKAGLGAFADHARPTDVLDTPASDEDTVVVARAVAAGG